MALQGTIPELRQTSLAQPSTAGRDADRARSFARARRAHAAGAVPSRGAAGAGGRIARLLRRRGAQELPRQRRQARHQRDRHLDPEPHDVEPALRRLQQGRQQVHRRRQDRRAGHPAAGADRAQSHRQQDCAGERKRDHPDGAARPVRQQDQPARVVRRHQDTRRRRHARRPHARDDLHEGEPCRFQTAGRDRHGGGPDPGERDGAAAGGPAGDVLGWCRNPLAAGAETGFGIDAGKATGRPRSAAHDRHVRQPGRRRFAQAAGR